MKWLVKSYDHHLRLLLISESAEKRLASHRQIHGQVSRMPPGSFQIHPHAAKEHVERREIL